MSVTNGSFANVSMLCPYVWDVGDRNISAFCCSSKENQSDTFYLDFGYDTTYAAVICTVVAILVWVFYVTFYLTFKHGICFCRDYEVGGASSDEDHNLGGNAKSAALHLTPDLLHLYGMYCTAVILTFYYDQHLQIVPGIDQYMKPFWPLLLADLLGITAVLLRLCSHCCSAPNRSALPSVPIRLGQLRSTDRSPPWDVALGGRKLGEREGHFNPNRKPKGFDTKQVFVTPSIVYAGLDAYASPKKFEDGDKVYKARAAFQLCIRPDSYEVGPETVGAKGKGETIDPLFSNNELEWSTKERGGTALYGLLVKLEPFDEESDDVGFDERLYAELRFSRTFEMLYLLDALAGLRFPDDDDD
uniref:Uncharacterized protein n=1 Tax=Branchiostoma floridae TaxID=7739 RepID=C3YUP7_BRAFL|eukprot:XP_002599936.1 hypothetical protein BRAFLDRAFT_74060 [Branchiostoma floridae]